MMWRAEGMPGTAEWLLRRLDLHVQLALRKILRRLEREADARLVAIWVVDGFGAGQVVEYAGDVAVLPRPFPPNTSSVPSYVAVTCADREEHDGLTHRIRLGRGMPAMGLVVVDAGSPGPDLMQQVEDCGERVEEIVVVACGFGR